MDVRSAVITCISVHICRESTLGVIGKFISIVTDVGNIATTFVKGDTCWESANIDLQAAVTEFNSALVLVSASMAMETVQKLGHIGEKVEQISKTAEGITLKSNGSHTFTGLRDRLHDKHLRASLCAPTMNEKFMIPYQKNEHFTGRQSLLARLCEKLCVPLAKQYNHRVALCGLGGVGKTQLALEYVYTHKALHDRVYWVSGADQTSLLSGFQEIANRTGCINKTANISPYDVAKSVLSWLNEQEGWLLVIDNLDDPAVVEEFLPERSPGRLTLLTTRNPNSDEFQAQALEVGVLDDDDAVELLSIRSSGCFTDSPQCKAEAEEIVREVGCLPLAIEQAAAYIREMSKDIFKFLPSYRKNRKRHHERVPKGNWKYRESIATTWRLSFQQVERNNKGASRLLQLLAFLNPDGIYTDFLELGKAGLEADLQAVISDPDEFYEALSELERFSLIRRQIHDGAHRIIVHRLVQSVILDDLNQLDRKDLISQVLRLGLSAFPDPTLLKSSASTLELSRRYRSQVMACLHHQGYQGSEVVWHALSMRVAGFLYNDGYYEDCAKLSNLTIGVASIALGPDHPETLQSMHNLASTYRRLARSEEAKELFQKTLDLRKKVLGLDRFETLQSMNGLGWAYADLAQYNEAYNLHQEALALKKVVLGSEHPETLYSMDGLAWAYWNLGKYHEACALHQETLVLSRKVLGNEHVDTLLSMDGLGWAQWRLGRYHEAAELFKGSLDIRKKIQGAKHPDTLLSLDGLAWAHWRLGQYKKATDHISRNTRAE